MIFLGRYILLQMMDLVTPISFAARHNVVNFNNVDKKMNNTKSIKSTKSLISQLSLAAFTFASLSVSSGILASDISQNLRNNTDQSSDSENYVELGLMVRVRDTQTFKSSNGEGSYTSTGVFINGSYTWNNLFIENYSESGHGLVVGYNAVAYDDWSLDLMVTTDWLKVSFENDGRYSYDDELMIGGRLSGYVGNNIVQFAINQDATGDHNGTTASALIGRNWQLRNWNFHGIIGAEYVSAKLNDYYVGVSDESAARWDHLEAYEAGYSVIFSSELGVTYPISEDWVFRATGSAVTIPDAITDSPRRRSKKTVATSFRTSISYVF